MESPQAAKYQQFITMMTAFVAGESRSRDFVTQMEGEFLKTGLAEDERFNDLELALAMFGVSDYTETNRLPPDFLMSVRASHPPRGGPATNYIYTPHPAP
jgi:hypothetical protein